MPNGENQMFLCLVLTGLSKEISQSVGKNVNKAPVIEKSPNLQYDSINTKEGGHYVVYDNHQAIPGYLITFS